MAKRSILLLGLCLSLYGSSQTKMVTHVTGSLSDFSTTVTLENSSLAQKTFAITPYDEAGNALAPVTGSIAAFEVLSLPASALFKSNNVSHFLIANGGPEVSVTYSNKGPSSHPRKASIKKASQWHFKSGDWSTEFDSVAVVNRGTEPTDVWIAQKTDKGAILQSTKIATALEPNAKITYLIGSPEGSLFKQRTNTHFLVSADQALSLTAVTVNLKTGGVKVIDARTKSTAESTRDDRGVWFITGGPIGDVIEMMGYNVAYDRLWQAEIFKRTARGRLAEIFGPDLVGQDILVRSTLYSAEEYDSFFAALDEESQTIIDSYAAGFNRRIGEVNGDPAILPFEFKALGVFQVENWTRADVMAWVALLQRNFSSLGNLGFGQVENGFMLLDLVDRYGPITGANMFVDARWTNDPQAVTMIPAAGKSKRALANNTRLNVEKLRAIPNFRETVIRMRQQFQENERQLQKIGAFVKGGSYAWAVAGSKTSSGNPIIYSGPQMGFDGPAICLEGSIVSDTLTISGMTVPGIPGIIIGRTPHHAWSMQVGHTSTWDFYLENESDVALHHVETIQVAGGDEVTVPVFRSARGPVVNQDPPLSWKYSNWGREWELSKGNFALARAQSMDEFGEGVAQLAVTQHFCYADKDGNIAYWMSGREPVRQPGEYRLPQGLLGSPVEWDSNVVHPPVHDRNTARGYYAGWNNKARPDVTDYTGTYSYGRYHRAQVVQDYLNNNDNLSYEQIRDFAIDIAATQAFSSSSGSGGGSTWPWAETALREAVAADPTPERTAALALFDNWDQHRVAGGPEGWVGSTDAADPWLLLDLWLTKIINMTFDDELGDNLNRLARFNVLIREFDPSSSTLTNNYKQWFKNAGDPSAPQTMQDIITTALDQSLAELGDRPWGIGQRGTIDYPHTLGIPIPGTPFGARSTYAHCVEFGATGPIRIESVFPLGQSGTILTDGEGNPVFDEHFFSMRPFFDTFTLRSFPLFQ